MLRKAYLEISNICNLSCSFCPGTGREPRVICTLSSFNDAAAVAAAGAGVCIYPETQDGPYPGVASKVITEPERIAENMGAAEVKLTPDEVAALDDALENMRMSAVFGGSPVKE